MLQSPPEVCTECRFDGDDWTDDDAVAGINELGARWSKAIDGVTAPDLRRRPVPSMWSIAEYTDHVREVLFAMRFLLDTALIFPGTDLGDPPEPRFDPEPRDVDIDGALTGLSAEAEQLGNELATARPSDWQSIVSSVTNRTTCTGSRAMPCTTRRIICVTSNVSAPR